MLRFLFVIYMLLGTWGCKELYAQPNNMQENDVYCLGSPYTRTYHISPDCVALRKTKSKYGIYTVKTEEALSHGRKPCMVCLKRSVAQTDHLVKDSTYKGNENRIPALLTVVEGKNIIHWYDNCEKLTNNAVHVLYSDDLENCQICIFCQNHLLSDVKLPVAKPVTSTSEETYFSPSMQDLISLYIPFKLYFFIVYIVPILILLAIIVCLYKFVLNRRCKKGSGGTNEPTRKKYRPRIHNTRTVYDFLNLFKKEDGLKYTTHSWDGIDMFKDFDALHNHVRKKFLHEGKELEQRCSHLYKQLYSFLLALDGDSKWEDIDGNEIQIGYNKYLKAWMDKTGKSPFDMLSINDHFPQDKTPSTGRALNGFRDVVNRFKQVIEFRTDGYTLYDMMCDIADEYREKGFDIEEYSLESFEGIRFYTDTIQVRNVLRMILGSLLDHSTCPKVRLQCKKETERNGLSVIKIEIIHIGSFADVDVNSDKIEKQGIHIQKKLKSLCDYSIESRFKNGKFYHVDLLVSEDNPKAIEEPKFEVKDCEGFKHILTFYDYRRWNVF